jgi:alpha-L-fucosidase
MSYEPNRESVSRHPVPTWYQDAKFGIFIHWGLYSVPAWAPIAGDPMQIISQHGWLYFFRNNPYAEWYQNSLRIEHSPTRLYHTIRHGVNFDYSDFAPLFQEACRHWDPNEWADLFASVGARYVVFTAKHHDGFLLWPSSYPNPHRPDYRSERDLVGELARAVSTRGLRLGLYYSSGLDWTFNDRTILDISDIPQAIPDDEVYRTYVKRHWMELIDRYEPAILWSDIAYPPSGNVNELFAYYYNRIPDGVVNDRFNQSFEFTAAGLVKDNHYDFQTFEYLTPTDIIEHKWEMTRGFGYSFGYNRNEGPEHYLSTEQLVHLLVDVVSKNGNLLLNVGPMADGTIPPKQRERLLELGRWLQRYGEAIFATRPWVRFGSVTEDGVEVRFTTKESSLYVILLGSPHGCQVRLRGFLAAPNTSIVLLPSAQPLTFSQEADSVVIQIPSSQEHEPAYVLKVTPMLESLRTQ